MGIRKVIAGTAFIGAMFAATSVFAFETTSINGTNPDGSAHYQDPDEINPSLGGLQFGTKPTDMTSSDAQKPSGSFGNLQFGVTGTGSNQADSSEGVDPWTIKPPPAPPSFYGSPFNR